MDKETATRLLRVYGEAWETQDPDLIVSIFTPDATYNDPGEPKNQGHEGIRAYWESKVVSGQRDIKFNLLNVWVDGDTVIAEWDARFVDVVRNVRIEMIEVGVFTVTGNKFSSLREYYTSVKTPLP